LNLYGHIIDTVAVTGHRARFRGLYAGNWLLVLLGHLDDVINLSEWDNICNTRSSLLYQPTREPMIDVFWQSLLLGLNHDGFEQQKREFAAWYRDFCRHHFLHRIPLPWRSTPFKLIYGAIGFFGSIRAILDQWRGTARNYMFNQKLIGIYGRRMIRTKNGYIGMATGEVKPGDALVLLMGGKAAYVLRMGRHRNEYNFVGDCYLHGAMQGELWDPEQCAPIVLV
jgi:hypothetical protein